MPVNTSGWTGWITFASVFMIVIGIWNAIEGLVAILKKTVFVSQGAHLIVTTNYNAWGWTLLIWGVVVFLAGLGLFAGQAWARWFAIVVIIIDMIGLIAWFPAFPLWNLGLLALNAVVLYALTARWGEVRAELRG